MSGSKWIGDTSQAMPRDAAQSPGESQTLKIFIIGDIPTDADLIEQTLRQAGLLFVAKRAGTQDALIQALEQFNPDIVLSDCKLPDLDGLEAIMRTMDIPL